MQPRSKGWRRNAAVLMGLALCSTAIAQHVWLDDKGVRQYSDRPPPPSVPANRIIKPARNGAPAAPEMAPAAKTGSSADAPAAQKADAPAGTSAKAPPTLQERNADFNRRRAEQAEKDKKADEAQRQAEDRKRNCERALASKRSLESGARIIRTTPNGEQAVLGEEQRAQELQEVSRALEGCA
ncbi:MAG: hypothetical protein JWP36_1739 [Paucimonas sp.]|nr:hypothetical protein [Paucimonas sp.]